MMICERLSKCHKEREREREGTVFVVKFIQYVILYVSNFVPLLFIIGAYERTNRVSNVPYVA